MHLLSPLLTTLTAPPLAEMVAELRQQKAPPQHSGSIIRITSGLRAVDLYCYLRARFGSPNGIQNILRENDSDNWIHWHYSLRCDDGPIEILAMTYRIEVWVPHAVNLLTPNFAEEFVTAVRADFGAYSSAMGQLRSSLEKWQEFLNPHALLTESLNRMCDRVQELVGTLPPRLPHPQTLEESNRFGVSFERWLRVHAEVNGLCQAIRMLAPVAAESFVNLLIFVLLKPELRAQNGFHDGFVRRQIHERVGELHLHCQHFLRAVDWTAPDCRALHTLMNRRNDYLHGNFNPARSAYGTVYFNGTVPIFTDWRDFYDRSFGPYLQSFSAQAAVDDLIVVEGFKSYVLTCIDPAAYANLRLLSETVELGFNPKTHRIGMLFSGIPPDGFAVVQTPTFVDAGAGI